VNLNRHLIAFSASSAWSFDFCHRLVASTTASSHTLVIPRLVAKSQGDCPVVFVNSLISFALNRFAFVDILAPLGVIAFTPLFISLVIDFHIPVSPPRYPACQYLSTFHITGVATAHKAPHTAAPVAISSIVASLHLSSIGCVAQNPAPTTADLPISH
jgi:hypothetical protein